jgi:carbonic anhydrase/acetyltransferase-like protein (isoleucine patch superfamily)
MVLVARNGQEPRVHPAATVSLSAQVIGNVEIAERCYVDAGAVVASSGPPVVLSSEVIVFAGAVIRSTGGESRPAFPVRVGARTLVSPRCILSGCQTGRRCYLATAAILLQGAVLGDDVRVGVDAIVHAKTHIPDTTRIGMRHMAVPTSEGFVTTANVEEARQLVGAIDFFGEVFGAERMEQLELHDQVMTTLLEEVHSWRDEPLP